MRRHHALPFGAELLERRRTRFRLWAPSARAVHVQIRDGGSHEMTPTGDGWFAIEVACGAGTRYRYRIDDELLVPDPASRAQDGDVHGDSVVVDPQRYRWRHPEWAGRPWREAVIYEAHAGVFGGFRGLLGELARLKRLGVTALELMPIAEFPGAHNWGYDGVLPFAPDQAYGTPEDLKKLIDKAHGLGLMVYLDVVYNHFGPDGNYLARYAKSFFREDLPTLWGEAIDFRQTSVRDFFIQNALFWLHEYRFDGLRLDAVHAIRGRDFLDELVRRVRESVEPGRHVHLVLENEDNAASLLGEGRYDAQWNDDGHNVLHVLLTGEEDGYYAAYKDAPVERLRRCLSEGFIYQGEPTPVREGRPRGEPSAHLPPSAFVLFLQNHDQVGNRAMGERLIHLTTPEKLRAATLLLLLMPQIPLLFMGEEWGCTVPFLFFTDHNPELGRAVRDGRRREFAHFGSFAADSIPDPNDPQTFRDSRPDPSADSPLHRRRWLRFYRRLLKVRRAELVPRLQQVRSLEAHVRGPAAVEGRWRLGDGSVLGLALNLGEAHVGFSAARGAQWLAGTPASACRHAEGGRLLAQSAIAWLEPPPVS